MAGVTATGSNTADEKVKPREVVIPIITTLLGAAIGVYGADLASDDDAISRRTADAFIHAYYEQVTNPATVQEAWETRLSAELQEVDDLSSFTAWWSSWSDIQIDGPALANPDVENGFMARIAYVDTGGQTQSYRFVMYQLDCANPAAGHIPFVTCDAEDVRLIDTWQPGTQ